MEKIFIDIHAHFQEPRGFPRDVMSGDTFATPSELASLYDKYSIEKGCILPLVSPEARYVIQDVNLIIEQCNNSNGRFIPFCNIDPRQLTNSPDADFWTLLLFYIDKGAKGVGEVTANLPFDHPLMRNLFKACEKEQIPMTIHIADSIGGKYGIYDDPGLPLLEKTLKDFPDMVILGHSQAFWSEIGELKNLSERSQYPKGKITKPGRVVDLMRKYENLHGDLSAFSGFNAISRDKEFGINFLNEFQDRLYFGTDICSPKGKAPLADYLLKLRKENAISEAVFRKIARENAKKLLKI
ncbi:MAG: amidohydrolase family protein [Promethearchaeota archaeon]